MNKKERRLGLATALQSAAADIVVVEDIKVDDKKTKTLLAMLAKLGVSPERKTLLITSAVNENVQLAGRNVTKLSINSADCLNVFDILNADKIIIESAAMAHIASFYGAAQKE